MQVTYKTPDDIKLNERNSRLHSDEQIAQIADSIERLGFNVPVLIDKTGTLIAGEGRVCAAMYLELEEIPCIQIDHLSDDQLREFMIVDNKLAMNSSWNNKMLSVELKHLSELGLELKAFDPEELQRFTMKDIEDFEFEEKNPDNLKTIHVCPKCSYEW